MLLTVSGPAGSGKSTTAAGLAEALDLEHVSGGDIFRELATERGYTPVEFNELAEEDERIDRDLDQRLYEIARDRDGLVLESRLAGWLAPDADFRLWLDAPVNVRAARIADREEKSIERAREETLRRERSERKRYSDYYEIPIDDLSIYDLVVNTARWTAPDVLAILTTAIERYDPAVDEGRYTINGVDLDSLDL
ncbi:(d)CMP kinase [Haloplanus aerogenes]|uniref:Cytidylate kinase n=1 Tax=Haloplanus aerogenes TaxID=660522 RepID=A0A3G8QWI4_9EURY|nr:AAA family ATPase [Haloplanus aerogenes]AZH26826.1 cytidylate kinase [Haloplanus aerogenes]RMB09082.1 cytidylate kinase [Haloplanus aerogenes]